MFAACTAWVGSVVSALFGPSRAARRQQQEQQDQQQQQRQQQPLDGRDGGHYSAAPSPSPSSTVTVLKSNRNDLVRPYLPQPASPTLSPQSSTSIQPNADLELPRHEPLAAALYADLVELLRGFGSSSPATTAAGMTPPSLSPLPPSPSPQSRSPALIPPSELAHSSPPPLSPPAEALKSARWHDEDWSLSPSPASPDSPTPPSPASSPVSPQSLSPLPPAPVVVNLRPVSGVSVPASASTSLASLSSSSVGDLLTVESDAAPPALDSAKQPGAIARPALLSVTSSAIAVGARFMSPNEIDDGASCGQPPPAQALDPDDGSLEGWGMAADLGHFHASVSRPTFPTYQVPKPLYAEQDQHQQQQQSQPGWQLSPRRTPSQLPGAPVLVAYSLHTATTTPPTVPRYSPPLPLWPHPPTSTSSATASKLPSEFLVPSSPAVAASSETFASFAAAAATDDDDAYDDVYDDAAAEAAWRDLEARLALRKLAGIGLVTRSRRVSGGAKSLSLAVPMAPSSQPIAPEPSSYAPPRAPSLLPAPVRSGNAALLARLAPHLFGRPGTSMAAAASRAAAAATHPALARGGAPSAATRPVRPSPLRVEAASWATAVHDSADVDAPQSSGESATRAAPAAVAATGGQRSRAGSDVSSAAASLSTAAGSVVIHDSDDDDEDDSDDDEDNDGSDDGGFDDGGSDASSVAAPTRGGVG
ncbi:hypothetical protein HK405_011219, partial [Cladochytrium tenue]